MTATNLLFRHLSCTGLTRRTLGRVASSPVSCSEKPDTFLVVRKAEEIPPRDALVGYAAVLLARGMRRGTDWPDKIPCVKEFENFDGIPEDGVVLVDPKAQTAHVLYRPDSPHNAIFATNRCNSRCIMCSQPPTAEDDSWLQPEQLRLIELIRHPPQSLGITGGEPTLLGDGLLEILGSLRDRFPQTPVYMLTNGRLFAYEDFAKRFTSVGHVSITLEVPLYADTAPLHDRIVQAVGAFDQTITGLYNLARYGGRVGLRVVLHRQTVPRLVPLIEFIYRNLPFVSHVALMGLEPMGYVKKNWDQVWIDPLDYCESLKNAVRYAFLRGLPVSIYNLPLCVLPKSLWSFTRKSISDFKNIYLDVCEACDMMALCGGLFQSAEARHSRGIQPIKEGAQLSVMSRVPR
jgi:His-Xaa-Ser system radical SAM maturase HxsC